MAEVSSFVVMKRSKRIQNKRYDSMFSASYQNRIFKRKHPVINLHSKVETCLSLALK